MIDPETRRPGVTDIVDGLRKKYPLMSYDQALAQAKEIWDELYPNPRDALEAKGHGAS